MEKNIDFKKVLEQMKKHGEKIKTLQIRLQSTGGRVDGKIIAPRKGELIRRIYRFIDFKRNYTSQQKAIFVRTIYDPNRTAAIGIICYPIGILNYILKPTKIEPGDFVGNIDSNAHVITYGDASKIANFNSGILLYNVNGKFIRSAGASAILVRKDAGQALLKMKSGELRYFNQSIIASSGTVSNEDHFLRNYRKAGVIRLKGRRPRTRPSSMNPVDHPMGGRTRGGCFPKNKKGIITLNRPTVKKHNINILYTKRHLKLLNS